MDLIFAHSLYLFCKDWLAPAQTFHKDQLQIVRVRAFIDQETLADEENLLNFFVCKTDCVHRISPPI